MTINIGDEVYLTYTAFTACPGYPVIGSVFECSGVVAETSPSQALIHWRDGTFRTFSKTHLTLASELPGCRCKSIW